MISFQIFKLNKGGERIPLNSSKVNTNNSRYLID